MTKLWHGTNGNDLIAGSDTESNIFLNVGTGQDTVIGGQRDDRFMMTVDALNNYAVHLLSTGECVPKPASSIVALCSSCAVVLAQGRASC